MDLRELYQEVILDHNKRPRNFKVPDPNNRRAEGYNPLCGDKITIYLYVEGNLIKDLGFQGTGCAILTWQGRPVSMICFNSGKTPGSTNPDLFLFVIDRAATPDAPQVAIPQVATVKHLATASWSAGDKTYVLATSAAGGGIEQYF